MAKSSLPTVLTFAEDGEGLTAHLDSGPPHYTLPGHSTVKETATRTSVRRRGSLPHQEVKA